MMEQSIDFQTPSAWRPTGAPSGASRPRLRSWAGLLNKPMRTEIAHVKVQSMLDHLTHQLRGSSADVEQGMTELLSVLYSVKSENDAAIWESVIAQCVSHPVQAMILEDPFASRCFQKPRGYAGDAVLIDYLYTRECGLGLSALGRQIFNFTHDMAAGYAVRLRCGMMATAIDQVCQTTRSARILSVACGHLREAQRSNAVAARLPSRFVALDQDALSLEVVQRDCAKLGVTTVHNSIKGLFRGPVAHEKFDLIYSTGLYDYLDDRLATKLTARMFEMLNPGGRLMIANFVPNLICSGYMDAMLDWKLIYRDVPHVRNLAAGIPQEQISKIDAFVEEHGNIAFLDISRN